MGSQQINQQESCHIWCLIKRLCNCSAFIHIVINIATKKATPIIKKRRIQMFVLCKLPWLVVADRLANNGWVWQSWMALFGCIYTAGVWVFCLSAAGWVMMPSCQWYWCEAVHCSPNMTNASLSCTAPSLIDLPIYRHHSSGHLKHCNHYKPSKR